jgi:hypothetical protein
MNWLEIVNALGTAGIAVLGTVVFGWYRSAKAAELEAAKAELAVAKALSSPTLLSHLREIRTGFENELIAVREDRVRLRTSLTETGTFRPPRKGLAHDEGTNGAVYGQAASARPAFDDHFERVEQQLTRLVGKLDEVLAGIASEELEREQHEFVAALIRSWSRS